MNLTTFSQRPSLFCARRCARPEAAAEQPCLLWPALPADDTSEPAAPCSCAENASPCWRTYCGPAAGTAGDDLHIKQVSACLLKLFILLLLFTKAKLFVVKMMLVILITWSLTVSVFSFLKSLLTKLVDEGCRVIPDATVESCWMFPQLEENLLHLKCC